jgi:hypothetical protein
LPFDRDLALLHGLEEARLRPWSGAVNLIRQDHVGLDRARPQLKVARLLVIEEEPGDIGRQQIGRELDATERAVQTAREGSRQRRLAHAGHVFDEHVAFTQQRHGQQLDRLGFPDNDTSHLLDEVDS